MARPPAVISVRQAFTQVCVIDLAGELTSSNDVELLNAYQQVSKNGAQGFECLSGVHDRADRVSQFIFTSSKQPRRRASKEKAKMP